MKILSILLLSFIANLSFSQVWIDSGAKWTFDYFNVGETGTWKFEYKKDTVLQGKQSEVIAATRYMHYGSNFINETNAGQYYTYSSNDSVFYYHNGQFFLLYDFGAQIGDSWVFSVESGSGCADTSRVHVTNIGSLNINGQTLRTLTLQSDTGSLYAMNGLCVEKFGLRPATFSDNNLGFMPGYQNCNSLVIDYDLLTFRCYEDDSFATYNPSGKSCDTLMKVNELIKESITLYPNPVSDLLTISISDEEISIVSVLDLNGRKVVEEFEKSRIDLSLLERGIYLVKIQNSSGKVVTRRIVKE